MSQATTIAWTDATWNPVRGCTRKSEGCRHCYAEKMAARFSGRDPRTGKPMWGHGFATVKGLEARWTGKVALIPEQLDWPLRWRGHPCAKAEGRPSRIFVNSTSDLFHENLPDEAIDQVFAVMALAQEHVFQVLTKRPERMRAYFDQHDRAGAVWTHAQRLGMSAKCDRDLVVGCCNSWPLPNVWLGTSVDDQPTADERIPELLNTPAAVRFISGEPLLGPLDLTRITVNSCDRIYPLKGYMEHHPRGTLDHPRLDWVIAGGESGRGSETRGDIRPAHPDWFRKLRDDCAAAGVPFFFKQWGGWAPYTVTPGGDLGGEVRRGRVRIVHPGGESDVDVANLTGGRSTLPRSRYMQRVDKGDAGNTLDGRQHLEFPKAPQLALAGAA
jgi:protein gp37